MSLCFLLILNKLLKHLYKSMTDKLIEKLKLTDKESNGSTSDNSLKKHENVENTTDNLCVKTENVKNTADNLIENREDVENQKDILHENCKYEEKLIENLHENCEYGKKPLDNCHENCEYEERPDDFGDEDKQEALFDPPLYKQRYQAVAQMINENQAKRVLDMGCSEGKFLEYVKENCPCVEDLTGVDIDESLFLRNVFRLQPRVFDYLVKRDAPLTMRLMHGSIIECDEQFVGIDFVSCIEVIEHLYDSVLARVPATLFGRLKAKVVVVTTPNCEYNALFSDFSGLRHDDHKFEWTRDQFKKWCERIASLYPYQVKIGGVGDSPSDKNVGHCSQLAVFTCTNDNSQINDFEELVSDEKEFLEDLNTDIFCHHNNHIVCHRSISEDIVPLCKSSSQQQQPPDCNCGKVEETTCELNGYVLVKEQEQPYNKLNANVDEAVSNEIGYQILTFFSDVPDDCESDEIEKRVPLSYFFEVRSIAKLNLTYEQFVASARKSFTLDAYEENVIFHVASRNTGGRWYDEDDDDFSDHYDDVQEALEEQEPKGDFEEEENWDLE